jgi:RNA polymerase sigma factor (sigma-70 family)
VDESTTLDRDGDAAALEAWRGGDEAGLRELIARHGPMVHAACRRRLGDGIDADEAAQAAFVALARRARQLRDGRRVAAWLHAVAVRACAQSARASARRRRHEAAAGRAPVVAGRGDDGWSSARVALDEAIARLPETQRAAVIQRFFAGRSFAEVGAALGTSEDAAKKRVAAALERLRLTLTRRGVALSAVALTAGLGTEAASAEAAAPSAITVLTAPPTAAARRLAQEVLRMLLIRSLLAPLALAALLAVSATIALHAEDPPPAPRHHAVDETTRYSALYYFSDVVGGRQHWYPPKPELVHSLDPVPADHGAAAAAIEAARTSAELIARLRAELAGAGDHDASLSILYPGMPRGDLLASLGSGVPRDQLDEVVDQARRNIDCTVELIPGLIGADGLAITTTRAGHRRMDALLHGARDLRAEARVPWRESVARDQLALMPALRADPQAAQWPSRAVPAAIEAVDGEQKVRLRTVFLPEVPRDSSSSPILFAGGVEGRGTFVLCSDGTRVWLPDGDAFRWAEHVREAVDTGTVRGPLTTDALRGAARAQIERKPAASVGGKPPL